MENNNSAQNDQDADWDVVVVGAGAAGLLAAHQAARRGLKTLLVEKNRKIGVKILISGGTRCNVTHDGDPRSISDAFGRQGRFLHSALAALSPENLVDLLSRAGVPTKVEAEGKVFPRSDRAIDVRDALVAMLKRTRCEVRTNSPVIDVAGEGDTFRVVMPDSAVSTRNLIVTTGGMSYPGCGTVGDGYGWAERFGHQVVPPVPALAPIVVGDRWPRDLKGITVADTRLTVVRDDGKVVEQSRASLLFTHFGFSGPAPMNVSRAFERFSGDRLKLRCDFWPSDHVEGLLVRLSEQATRHAARSITSVFRPELSRRLVEQILRLADIDPARCCSEVPRRKLTRAVELLKRTEFRIQGTRGFHKAEVTAGGIELREVDSSTMRSKRRRGLYFAGEILDLDGPIGGYNFQAAFSTGWLAGQRVGLE